MDLCGYVYIRAVEANRLLSRSYVLIQSFHANIQAYIAYIEEKVSEDTPNLQPG